MPITTLAKVKEFLDISATTYDSIIETLIPIVQKRVVEITGNDFMAVPDNSYSGLVFRNFFTFAATAGTITADSGSFEDWGFKDDDDIRIKYSYRNDGYYVSKSVSTSVLTISTAAFGSGAVVTELSGASILIGVVNWDDAIEPVVANMIRFDYAERPTLSNKASESLGPYSVSYSDVNSGTYGYPREIINGLMPWTNIRFI